MTDELRIEDVKRLRLEPGDTLRPTHHPRGVSRAGRGHGMTLPDTEHEAVVLGLVQGLRLIRDSAGEYAANVAARVLREAGIEDPDTEDVAP